MAEQLATQIHTSSIFQATWDRALKEYAENLPPEEKENANLRDPKWQQIRSVDDLISELTRRHGIFDEDTGRGTVSSTVLSNCLTGIQALINMFGGAAGTVFPPSSQILGAVSILLNAAYKVSQAFNQVRDLFTRISDFMVTLKVLTQVTLEKELEKVVTSVLVCTLRICGMATRKAYHDETIESIREGHTVKRIWRKTKQKSMSRGSQYLKQLVWGEDPEISAEVSRLQQNVEAEQRIIAALTKKDTTEIKAASIRIDQLSHEIYDTTVGVSHDIEQLRRRVSTLQSTAQHVSDRVDAGEHRIRNDVADVMSGVERVGKKLEGMDELLSILRAGGSTGTRVTTIQASKSTSALSNLKTTLQPVENAYQSLLATSIKDRAPGTCDWILQETMVNQWLQRDSTRSPVLIISGATGSGKTFLAARIIQELQEKFTTPGQERPTSWAYFFCRKNLAELSSANNMLRTLAYQISELDSQYATYINAKNRLHKIKQPESVSKLWNALFVDYYRSVTNSSTVLVIDGVDECLKHDKESVQDFVDALQSCVQGSAWTLPNVHVLLSVELENGKKIEEVLGGGAAYFTITEAHTMEDLDTFVKDKLAREWKDNIIDPNLRKQVHKTVKEHCKGDFLRTSLLLDEVTSLSRAHDIWALVSKPPMSVEEATLLVLRRIQRGLDKHGLEDLVDILAWVAKSHESLSLATLDAILTIRGHETSRLINLKELLVQKYSALFVVSNSEGISGIQPKNVVTRRLALDEAVTLPATGPSSGFDYRDRLKTQYTKQDETDLPQEKMKRMSYTEVRLADNIVDRLDIVTKSLTEDDIAGKTLWECLKAMCDPLDTVDEDAALKANEYCAKNVINHLLDVDVEAVDAMSTRQIVRLLLKLLRDESTIDRWLDIATWQTMFLLVSSGVEEKLMTWFQSPNIQGRLSQIDLEWIDRAKESPTECLFLGVALGHARQWLFRGDGRALHDNFQFIGIYRWMVDKAQSRAETFETFANIPNLSYSSTEEICALARWAQLPEDSLWYQRLGSALYEARQYHESLVQYQKSLDADPMSPMNHHCMGETYRTLSIKSTDDSQQAIYRKKAISCFGIAIDKYKQRMTGKESTIQVAAKDQDGYRRSVFLLVVLYENAGETSEAETVLRRLVSDWESQALDKDEIDHITGWMTNEYLNLLLKSDKDDEATTFLESLIQHPQAWDPCYCPIYCYRVNSSDDQVKLAYRTKRFDILDSFWQQATFVVAVRGSAADLAEVRYSHAYAMARLAPERRDHACRILQKIISDPDTDHYIADDAEKELGRIHLDLALEARDEDDWLGVAKHFPTLHNLAHETDDAQTYKKNESTLFLASWYQLHRRSEKAKDAVRARCKYQLAFLYDEQPDNDQDAWYHIANLTLAVGDRERAMAVTNLVRSISAHGNDTNIINSARLEAELVSNTEVEGSADAKQESELAPTNASKGHLNGTVDSTVETAVQEGTRSPPRSTHSETDLATSSDVEQHTPMHDSSTPTRRSQEIDDRSQSTGVEAADGSAPVASQALSGDTLFAGANPAPSSTDEKQTVEAAELKVKAEVGESRYYVCNGPCTAEPIAPHEHFHRCTICLQDFCEECYQMVKSAAMPDFKLCSSSHDWLLMPAVEQCPDNCILVRGMAVPLLDWLDGFADAYGIPRWIPGAQTASMVVSPA